MATKKSIYSLWLKAMLRPLVRYAVRHAIQIQFVIEVMKEVFLEIASEEIGQVNTRVNMSRLSAITGLQRKDIKVILQKEKTNLEPKSIIAKVLGQWMYDRSFTSQSGRPKTLSLDGSDSEFYRLVKSVSTDLHPGTILFELERVGAVERTARGIRLAKSSYNPQGDISASLQILAADYQDLTNAVEDNVMGPSGLRHHHLRTEFDNIRPEEKTKIETWLITEGGKLHDKARGFLASLDRDLSPKRRESSAPPLRVALGSFSFIEENPRDKKT